MLVEDYTWITNFIYFYISHKGEFSKTVGIAKIGLQLIMREKERFRILYSSTI